MTIGDARRGFRRWRRTRPFWGGLFLLLSAIELFASANLTLRDLQVHFGQEGYLSYVLPAVLILCGTLIWATPAQRLFYGVLGLLTALYSFLGLNLGGFGLGMLLGIIGGALTIAWRAPGARRPPADVADAERGAAPEAVGPDLDQPTAGDAPDTVLPPGRDTEGSTPSGGEGSDVVPPSAREPDDSTPPPGEAPDVVLPSAREPDDSTPPPGEAPDVVPGLEAAPDDRRSRRGAHRKLLVITLVPVAVTATVLASGGRTPARADTCPDGLPSRPAATAHPAGSSVAAGRPPAAAPSSSAAPQPAATGQTGATGSTGGTDGTGNPIVDGWNHIVDGVGRILGIGGSASPTPSPGTSPTSKPGAPRSSKPGTSPTGKPAASGAAPGRSGPPSRADVPCLGPRVLGKRAGPSGVPLVTARGARLEGRSLEMYNSTYDGTVNLPTAQGPLRTLKFSMVKSVTKPFSLTVPEPGGQTTVIRSNALTTEGHVTFYTPRFEGKLFGLIPVTFTPDSPPPLTLPYLEFTDVRITLTFVSCDTLTADPLDLTETA